MVVEQHIHAGAALLPGGWARDVRIGVANGVVSALQIGVAADATDDIHAAVVPGAPNIHSHAFQRGMAGLAEQRGPSADSFWTWRETMYRFVGRLDPEGMTAIAALAYIEMLESGFTRVGEFHYLHHDRDGRPFSDPAEMSGAIMAAAAEAGIGLSLLPVFYAHSGFGGAAPTAAQRRFICDLDGFARLVDAARGASTGLPDGVVGIAPHSLRAVTPHQLSALMPLATSGPVHIHIAEQTQEVEDCLRWFGARPVDWLLDHQQVDARWCLVHATHITPKETARLAASQAIAGLCPITEANLGDGVFPAEAYLSAGGRIGIGSDSNVLIDLSEELRLLEYGQRLTGRARNVLSAEDSPSTGDRIYRAALQGAAALGVGASAISPGESADFVSLNMAHPCFFERGPDRWLDAWIFAAGSRGVDCVWRRGRKVVSSGVHVARDVIVRRYRRTLEKILA